MFKSKTRNLIILQSDRMARLGLSRGRLACRPFQALSLDMSGQAIPKCFSRR